MEISPNREQSRDSNRGRQRDLSPLERAAKSSFASRSRSPSPASRVEQLESEFAMIDKIGSPTWKNTLEDPGRSFELEDNNPIPGSPMGKVTKTGIQIERRLESRLDEILHSHDQIRTECDCCHALGERCNICEVEQIKKAGFLWEGTLYLV